MKPLKSLLVFLTAILTTVSCYADFKLDTLFGYYSLEAKNSTGSGSLSALGLYSFYVRKSFLPKFDFGIGYSIMMSKSFVGDASYGPDLGIFYFPLTNARPIFAESSTTVYRSNELIKPYVGLNFHQRNYTASKSTYGGFSGIVGCEFEVGYPFMLNAQFRYLSLQGPQGASATDINVMGGITFWF